MDIENHEQAEYWGASPAGLKWIDAQDHFDSLLQPVLDTLLARAGLQAGDRVLDIGSGTGASLLAAGQQVGATGSVLGADISPPFVEVANARLREAGTPWARARLADAQAEPFEPGAYDKVISRFGVMFFADPTAAFANIAKAIKPGGTLSFAAWDSAPMNPWFSLPARIASERLGQMPPSDPHAPGPMAFADTERVLGILDQAGLKAPSVETIALTLKPLGGIEPVSKMAAWAGPASRIVAHFGGTDEDAAAIETAIRTALAEFDGPDGLNVPASVHFFSATA